MEFFDTIAKRCCHKAAFSPDPVPDAHLRQIVEAGMLAPSPANVQACEFVIDYLKTRAPFWKKETTADGDRWVDARHSDSDAEERWKR